METRVVNTVRDIEEENYTDNWIFRGIKKQNKNVSTGFWCDFPRDRLYALGFRHVAVYPSNGVLSSTCKPFRVLRAAQYFEGHGVGGSNSTYIYSALMLLFNFVYSQINMVIN